MKRLRTAPMTSTLVPLKLPTKAATVCRRHFQLPCSGMNNSERARFYRVQNKRLTLELTLTVAKLRDQVNRLHLGSTVSRALVRCGITRDIRGRILAQLKPFMEDPRQHLVFPAFDVHKMELLSASGSGTNQAAVVEITSVVAGTYTTSSVETVYQFFPGNTVLLDTLMHAMIEYRCVIRFFFAAEGSIAMTEVEVDWICGLVGSIGRLAQVMLVAEPLRDLGDPFII